MRKGKHKAAFVKFRWRYQVLHELIGQHGYRVGAEIGVHRGDTFERLLRWNPELTLYGVDIWMMPRNFRPHVEKVAAAIGDRARLMHIESVEAARHFAPGELDFVFIDGNHDREHVTADIAAWTPKVRAGGMVSGHDWNMESVRTPVIEAFGADRIALFSDNVWVVWR